MADALKLISTIRKMLICKVKNTIESMLRKKSHYMLGEDQVAAGFFVFFPAVNDVTCLVMMSSQKVEFSTFHGTINNKDCGWGF